MRLEAQAAAARQLVEIDVGALGLLVDRVLDFLVGFVGGADVEELERSRTRLVTAQDEERRRLERNLHDGAQQHLVALAVKLRLIQQVADGEEIIIAKAGKPIPSVLVPDVALVADQSLRYVLVVGPDEQVLRRDRQVLSHRLVNGWGAARLAIYAEMARSMRLRERVS